MEAFVNNFMEMLCYVPYIISEKERIQRFLSCLPLVYKDKIKLIEPKTLEEAIIKAKYCYNQLKE